jgi:hypothetical protein
MVSVGNRRNRDFADGPVQLVIKSNENADGGFEIRVIQKGRMVGHIEAGSETACIELAVSQLSIFNDQ